ncbi:unnamed protein product [Urochloa decumbens]|uniref:GOLD domain-containing protein n=1 Tax=Urochloa decumbens TaxID=240449 RepID=A0ABC8XBS7_9POAL
MTARVHVSLLPLLLLVLAVALPAGALRFDLHSGHTKCISDEIKVGAMAVGKYHIVAPDDGTPSLSSSSQQQQQLPDSHRISLRVTSPYGSSLHYAENVHSGNFAFTATEAGDYLACFWAPDHRPPVIVAFEFDWRSGVSARDWSTVAKKGQVETMELELRKLEDTIKSIHEEMFYLRERYALFYLINKYCSSLLGVVGTSCSDHVTDMSLFQGRRNAGIEPENERKNGLAQFAFTRHLPVSGWVAVVASEEFFREKEASMISFFYNPIAFRFCYIPYCFSGPKQFQEEQSC